MTDKKINIVPAPGYILLEPEDAASTTASGIVLPESAEEKPQSGKVLAVGDAEIADNGSKKNIPVKIGDMVIYKKWGGNEIKIDRENFMFVKFEDILATYK